MRKKACQTCLNRISYAYSRSEATEEMQSIFEAAPFGRVMGAECVEEELSNLFEQGFFDTFSE